MKSSSSKFNNIGKRVISGLIGGFIIIFSIYWHEWSYFVLFLLILLLTQFEFYQMTKIGNMLPLKFFGTLFGGVAYTIIFLVEKQFIDPLWYLALFPFLSIIFLVKLYWKADNNPFLSIAYTLCGIFYVAIPFALLHIIAFSGDGYSNQIILGFLFLLWASDTGAYFTGTLIGKTSLFTRISPKKTWEGSIGGGLLSLLLAFIISFYFGDLEMWQWLVMALIIVIFGTYGDLIASLLKRSLSLKDSGHLIPGHGGFLDRFDGLIFSSPFIAFFVNLF